VTGRRLPILLRLALTLATLGWAALIVLAPAWEAAAAAGVQPARSIAASIVRLAGAQVCHQRPERSFHLHGRPLAVCGRCTGLYVSGALGLLAVSARRRRIPTAGRRLVASPTWWPERLDGRTRWLATAAAPTLLTWALEVAGVWNPGTPLRALAALPLGLATGWLVGRATDA
jgi:uncharacterized membrane protein